MVGKLIGYLLGLLPTVVAKDLMDSWLDGIEKAVQGKSYEGVVMSLVGKLRVLIDVPDEVGEDQSNPV